MTQEEKSKAYDEAIKLARDYYKANLKLDRVDENIVLEDIFPELKESEDEKIKIRKLLIEAVIQVLQDQYCSNRGVSKEKVIAWLEKQGETFTKKDVDDSYLKGVTDTKNEIEKQGEQKPAEWHREDEQNLNACLGYIPDEFLRRWLMDVIHAKYDKPADKVEPKNYNSIDPHFGKPIDKVKPKFHEGEWVVFNNKHQSIYQVEKIEDGYYTLRHIHGGTFRVCVLHDESLRLWTIQDAKDGDVLCSEQIILLFKKLAYNNDWNHIIAYAGIDTTGKLQITDEQWVISSYVHPATKEQRDTLMKEMADAGYTFDFEKKVLKKIEQKNTDKIESKFHKGDWVVVSTTKGDKVVQIASVEYFKDGHPSYITTEGRWFGNGTKARLLTDKDVEITTIPESKIIVNKKKFRNE